MPIRDWKAALNRFTSTTDTATLNEIRLQKIQASLHSALRFPLSSL